MVTKTVSAWEARRNFGKLLRDVSQSGDIITVESHGEPIAAVVPIHVVQAIDAARRTFFDLMDKASAASTLTEEAAMDVANEVIARVRADTA